MTVSSAQLITNKLDSTVFLLQVKLRNAGAICSLANIVNVLIIQTTKNILSLLGFLTKQII